METAKTEEIYSRLSQSPPDMETATDIAAAPTKNNEDAAQNLLDMNQPSNLLNNSIISNECDLSFVLGDNDDNSLMCVGPHGGGDELPPFQFRLLSPISRSPSPIGSDLDVIENENIFINHVDTMLNDTSESENSPSPSYVSIHDVNSQITRPNDSGTSRSGSCNTSLETIFEGKFLHTPPTKKRTFFGQSSPICRRSLLEKATLIRLQRNIEKPEATQSSSETEVIKTQIFCNRGSVAVCENGKIAIPQENPDRNLR